MKQGGRSYNGNKDHNKKGMDGNYKCTICSRTYKQEYTRDRHERQCREYNKK